MVDISPTLTIHSILAAVAITLSISFTIIINPITIFVDKVVTDPVVISINEIAVIVDPIAIFVDKVVTDPVVISIHISCTVPITCHCGADKCKHHEKSCHCIVYFLFHVLILEYVMYFMCKYSLHMEYIHLHVI